MANLKVGKPDVAPDAPSHVPGIKRATRRGSYEKQPGHLPDGRVDRRALDRHQRREARSRSTRGCRTCRRPRGRAWRRRPHRASRRSTSHSRSTAPRRCGTRPSRRSRFALRDRDAVGAAIRSVILDVQVRIAARGAPTTRRSRPAVGAVRRAAPLVARRWHAALDCARPRSFPPFTGATEVELQVPCTYDFDVAAAQVPRTRCGTARCRSSSCSAARCSTRRRTGCCRRRGSAWDHEAEYRLPVAVWRETMDHHFPGSAWLRLAARDVRPPARLQGAARADELGATRWTALLGRRRGDRWTRSERDRRRGPLRGLRAVALPPLGDEEPAALDVRRRLPARAQRARIPTTAWAVRTRVPGRGRRRRASTCACASCTSSQRPACAGAGEPVDELDRRRRALCGLGRGDGARGRAAGDARRVPARWRSHPGRARARGAVARGARAGADLARARRARSRSPPSALGRGAAPGDGAGSQHDSVGRRRSRGGAAADVLLDAHRPARRRRRVRLADRSARASCAPSGGVRERRACGPCSSASRGERDTLLSSPIILRTTRGSRRRAPATCSTAARSTRCWS